MARNIKTSEVVWPTAMKDPEGQNPYQLLSSDPIWQHKWRWIKNPPIVGDSEELPVTNWYSKLYKEGPGSSL